MLENKDELLQFLKQQLSVINKKKEENNKEMIPLRAFCYNDPLKNKSSIAQMQFENALDRNDNYSINLHGQTQAMFGVTLEGKSDKKTLTKALDIVCKDKVSIYNITNSLNRLNAMKSSTKNSFSVPKKGEIFVKLFERLYREASISRNNITESLYKKTIKELELIIEEKFGLLHTNSVNYDKAIKIINEMIMLVNEDCIMDMNDKKKDIIHNFLKLNQHDLGMFCLIEGYNNKLIDDEKMKEEFDTKSEEQDNIIPVNSPQYIKILKEMNSEINKKINIYKEFLDDIKALLKTEDFEKPELIDDLKKILIDAKRNKEYKELLTKILKVALGKDPSYKPFLDIIKPTLGYSLSSKIPTFNKATSQPTSFDGILELFEQYGVIIKNVPTFVKNKKVADETIKLFDSVLGEIALEIINVAKRTVINEKKYELTYIDMENIISGLENNKKIVLEDEQNLRDTNLGFTENDPEEAREFIPLLLLEVELFNKDVAISESELVKTEIVEKMKEKGYRKATKELKEKISSIDDNLTLEVLNYLLDIESDKARYQTYYDKGNVPFYQGKESNFYYLLIKLACDCTDYIGDKTGNYHYDGVATRELIDKVK